VIREGPGHAGGGAGAVRDLTVVIACRDDPRVFAAVASVRGEAPVVVALVPDPVLQAGLLTQGVRVVASVPGNTSVSCARGLAAVRTGRAFIIDSDCIVRPGCLARMSALLDGAVLARARVHFSSDARVRCSGRIARLRDGVNNRTPVPAYTPGLGLRLDVAPVLGGHVFDERVFWAGDSELWRRARRAGLEVAYDPEAVIEHAPISLGHEMRSAFKLGMGTRVQVRLGLRPAYESPAWLARRLLGRLRPRRKSCPSEPPRPRPAPGTRLLALAWTVVYYAGYYAPAGLTRRGSRSE